MCFACGNKVGDQTGLESSVHAYYDYPRDCILHYTGKADTASPVEPSKDKIAVDGVWGDETTMELRRQLGLRVNARRDKALYKRLQKQLGVSIKNPANVGKFNLKTRRALQRKLGMTATGAIGKKAVKRLQKALNRGEVARW